MKKYFAALSTVALLGSAPYTIAASSTDLTVTGIITPAACTPSLSSGGKVDNGKILVKDLNQDTDTQLPTQKLQLSIACLAPTLFALDSTDNKSGSASSDWFGLGLTDAGEKIGYVYLTGQNPVADGDDVRMIESDDDGASWTPRTWLKTDTLSAFAAASGAVEPIFIQDLTMDLEVSTYIARADSLTLTDDVTLDGSATIEVKYL
jgi:type 1 fimbria pilin